MSVSTQFSPNEISDAGLAELRSMGLRFTATAGKFSEWLFGWADAETYRRHKGIQEATRTHCTGLPLGIASWTDAEVGQALEALAVGSMYLADHGSDPTSSSSMFIYRLHVTLSMEAGRRLRGETDGD